MSEDKLRLLIEFEEKQRKGTQKIDSIWKLIKSIHSSPILREWVTIESIPLCPFVVRDTNKRETVVHLLLAVPGDIKGDNVILPPWGYIVWQWPSCQLLSMMDIRNTSLPRHNLDNNYLITKEYADSIQKALDTDTEIPLPPEQIQDIYKILLGKSSDYKEELTVTSDKIVSDKEKQAIITEQKSTVSEYYSELYHHMKQAKDIIIECGHEELLREWKRIYTRMNEPHFSIAVVGEFSRGKSTLINRLLNLDILPVGVIPTTAMITRLLYGNEPKMWRIYSDGKKEQLPLNPESWKNLLANAPENGTPENGADPDPEGIIQIEVPNEWLKQTGIHIIDTPGAGDLTDKRSISTIDTISSCDATLVAINATVPLSLTERTFVQQHILSRKIPKVAIVLTHLDQISNTQRLLVLTYIKEKVARWAPEIGICSAHGSPILSDYSLITCAGTDSILDMLSSWASNDEHVNLRSVQIKTQLKTLMMILRNAIVVQKEIANLSNEQRQEILKTGERQLNRKKLDWEDLRLELLRKENDCISWLEKIVLHKKEDIIEKFQFDLRHISNPKEWWEEDFPFLLRQEMMAVASGLERLLSNRIDRDTSWLEEEAKKLFLLEMKLYRTSIGTGTTSIPSPIIDIKELDNTFMNNQLNDLNRMRLYTRIGAGIASILSYLIFGPFGIAVSIGGGIVSEIIWSKDIKYQKKELGRTLDNVIDQVLHNTIGIVRERLHNIYTIIFKDIQKQESIWFSASRQVLMNDAGSKDDIEKLENRILKIDELNSKLIL